MIKTCQPLPIDPFGFGKLRLGRCRHLDVEKCYPKTNDSEHHCAKTLAESLDAGEIGAVVPRCRDWYYEAVLDRVGPNTPLPFLSAHDWGLLVFEQNLRLVTQPQHRLRLVDDRQASHNALVPNTK